MTGLFAQALFPGRSLLPWLATVLFVGNLATWDGASQFQNIGDSLLTLWLLLALYLWQRSLRYGEMHWFYVLLVSAVAILAIGAKETGIIVGPALLLLTFFSRRGTRSHYVAAALIVAIDLAYGLLALH